MNSRPFPDPTHGTSRIAATRLSRVLAAVLVLGALPTAAHAGDDGWQWAVAPYLWVASVSSDLNESAPPVGNEAKFGDIISKIDMAFQIHAEGQGERFGAFADLTYLSLSDSGTRTLYSTDASIETTMFETGGVWSPSPGRFGGLEMLAGLRYLKVDFDATLTPSNVLLPAADLGLEESYTDTMLGLRHTSSLSDKWRLIARVDGSWGQTDGALNLSLMAAYRMKAGSLTFGYRYMDVELENDARSLDLNLSGPVLAFAFGF